MTFLSRFPAVSTTCQTKLMRTGCLLALFAFGQMACTVRQSETSKVRVVNGYTVEEDDPTWSFVVPLKLMKGGNGGICTGTFIGPKTLITAAHCVVGMDSVTVKGIAPKTILPNPKWDPESHGIHGFDVAFLIFDEKMSSSMTALSASKPTAGQDNLTMVGYGFTNYKTQEGSGTKRMGTTSIESVSSTGMTMVINTRSAKTDDQETPSIGRGDSGGPLLNSAREIIGIASQGGGEPLLKSVYAPVILCENIALLAKVRDAGGEAPDLTCDDLE